MSIKVVVKSNALNVANGDTGKAIAPTKTIKRKNPALLYQLKKKLSKTAIRINPREELQPNLRM